MWRPLVDARGTAGRHGIEDPSASTSARSIRNTRTGDPHRPAALVEARIRREALVSRGEREALTLRSQSARRNAVPTGPTIYASSPWWTRLALRFFSAPSATSA